MSRSYGLRDLYHLIDNPFSPSRADARKPEDIIIIGEKHRDLLDTIKYTLLETNDSRFILVLGEWGAGKTAVIKKAIYEIENKIKDKLFTIHLRVPREGKDLDELIFLLTIEGYEKTKEKKVPLEQHIKDTVDKWIKDINEYEELKVERKKVVPIFFNILERVARTGMKILIVIDQLENLQIPEEALGGEYTDLPLFIRDIFDNVGKLGQVVIILSAITYRFRQMFGENASQEWRKLIRASTDVKTLEKLSKDDVVLLFKTLLDRYRIPEFKDMYRGEKALAPFTLEAIEEIYRMSEGIPGHIYDRASTVLYNASRKGIEVIDLDVVRYLAGEYDFRWVDAVERLPFVRTYDIVSRILEASRKIFDITYIQTNIINKENMSSYLLLNKEKIKKEEDLDELLTFWRRGTSFLVYYQIDSRYKLSIVKVSERIIRRDTIEYLHKALSLSTPSIMGRPVAPIDTSVVLITSGRITDQASFTARGLEVAFGIKIREKIIDRTDPKSYGRFRALVEDLKNIEEIYGDLYSVPDEELKKIKEELHYALQSLRIIPR